MKLLYFHNPKFHSNRNLTVRRGVKWDVGEKEIIGLTATSDPLTEEGKDKIIKIVNIETIVKRFVDLTEYEIEFEHDPDCRGYFGLLNFMQSIYPNFVETEIVTLVFFDF